MMFMPRNPGNPTAGTGHYSIYMKTNKARSAETVRIASNHSGSPSFLPENNDAAYVGMESQILDCEHPIYQNITPYQHHGSIYGILKANENHVKAKKPVGEWNYEEIICDGDNIKVTLNGVVIVEGNIREATKNGTPDGKEHPGLFNKKGHIGFLGHGSPIKFRNIRIKELK